MKNEVVPPLKWDFSNMSAEQLGTSDGIDEATRSHALQLLEETRKDFEEDRNKKSLPFLDLPYQSTEKIKALAASIRGRFDNFVLLGIGGSALGPIALHQALHSPCNNMLSQDQRKGPRMFFIDNVDPSEVAPLLKLLDPVRTAVNVITKSGETLETMALFLLFKEWITNHVGSRAGKNHFIATTDPGKGTLREIAQKEGYATLDIPEAIGGRYSVLTSVGLFPAAVSGIDIDALLKGAADLDKTFQNLPAAENGAIWGAYLHYWSYTRRNKNVLVTMPYASGLTGMAQWFGQLWAESLGKERDLSGRKISCGQTPVVAVGATDQHSQLQLYMEGPMDKTIQFISVETLKEDLSLPSIESAGEITSLDGHSLGGLLQIEQRAIETALTEAGRPNCRITLPSLNAHAIGALFYFFEVQTAYAGRFYQVNPFDQPGVETGKKIIKKLLQEKCL
ncbi:MAG: glucose-6-phosphate isomerase [Nitrospira sp.]